MMHTTRRFRIAEVETPEILAEKLTQHSWTLCTGFKLGDLLFLNDSTSEDGAAEYAVIKGDQQVESITFGWCSEFRALQYIEELASGRLGTPFKTVNPKIEGPEHRGQCCA